jgi:hypothetical protein
MYFNVDFTGFLDCFLFDKCDHSFEFIGDLFIAEALGIGHVWIDDVCLVTRLSIPRSEKAGDSNTD